jgi:hypothetical protein
MCFYIILRAVDYVTIYLGSENVMNEKEPNRLILKSNQFFIHPQWDITGYSLNGNIALIRLPTAIAFNSKLYL